MSHVGPLIEAQLEDEKKYGIRIGIGGGTLSFLELPQM